MNVVVWRLPRVEPVEGEGLLAGFYRGWKALSWPPSHCPKCKKPLAWYDNLPVIGWIKLGGRCRYCKLPISIRYPIIEAITGLLFVFYYVMFFIVGTGPCMQFAAPDGIVRFIPVELNIAEHWPIYALDMMLISALLAASLIDAELFIIPLGIPWFVIPFALIEHAVFDRARWPGGLNPSVPSAALCVGATIGLVISIILSMAGLFPMSFSQGEPLLDVDKAKLREKGESADEGPEYTPWQIRREMGKEMLFLLPPLILGFVSLALAWKVAPVGKFWAISLSHEWIGGLLGSLLGLLVGGFVVWLVRILGSIGFGREAMGMGDIDLIAAVGAVLGPGAATVAFFIAPFFGILWAIYLLFSRKGRELPYGPYLSLASAAVMLFYCPIADYLSGGIAGVGLMLRQWLGA